jgi:hypothetical protein
MLSSWRASPIAAGSSRRHTRSVRQADRRRRAPTGWTNPLEALAHDLKLDESATKELQPIFDQYGALRRDRSRDIGKLREAMSAELQKPQFRHGQARHAGRPDDRACAPQQQKQNSAP